MGHSGAGQEVAHKSSVPDPGERFVCSWSGGKDSCLALYRAIQGNGIPAGLITMLVEGGGRTRNHGLATAVVEAQAESLDIPLVTVASSWPEYESRMVNSLGQLQRHGVSAGVFGDIDIDSHRAWEENVCAAAGMRACLPLWKTPRQQVIDEFLQAGFEARVVAVNASLLGRQFLGRRLDQPLIDEFSSLGVDACGENGEYHTIVTAGPLFRRPVELAPQDMVLRSGYWFLDFQLGHQSADA